MKPVVRFIVLLAFFVQGMIPLGFMPGAKAAQGTAMVICSGMDQKTIFVNDHGQPVKHSKTSSAAKPCAYGMVGFGAVPVHGIVYVPAVFAMVREAQPVSHILISSIFLLPDATGPPSAV